MLAELTMLPTCNHNIHWMTSLQSQYLLGETLLSLLRERKSCFFSSYTQILYLYAVVQDTSYSKQNTNCTDIGNELHNV